MRLALIDFLCILRHFLNMNQTICLFKGFFLHIFAYLNRVSRSLNFCSKSIFSQKLVMLCKISSYRCRRLNWILRNYAFGSYLFSLHFASLLWVYLQFCKTFKSIFRGASFFHEWLLDRGKGGLISESFKFWFKSFKKGAKWLSWASLFR